MTAADPLKLLEQPELIAETKDVIGFDLGHGDTSISRVPAIGGQRQILEAVKGFKVIPTVVGRRKDGSIVVGKDAFSDPKVAHALQQFKSPHITDPTVADPLRLFVSGVMEGLRRTSSTIPFDLTTLMVFGCPSAWSDEQRLGYGRLLAQQVSGMQSMLVPESRAAFITMKEERQLTQAEIREPILIVDLGSSTTDFTFVLNLDPAELSIGKHYPLGAACIEQQLLELALCTCPKREAIQAWWQQSPSEYHRTVWKFREAKEDFFRSEDTWRQGRPMEVAVSYWIGDTERIKLEINLTAAHFDAAIDTPLRALGERPIAWRDRFRADLEAASQRIHETIGTPPRIVVLTGGAARMRFIEEIANEVFPEPTVVRQAPEPEHAISIGLAHAGSIRYRTQAFLKEISEMINSGQVQDVIHSRMSSFAEAIAEVVTTDATQRFILPEFLEWRSSGEGKLKDIAERISARIEAWQRSQDGQQRILRALIKWYRQIERDLHNLTAPLCMKYNLAADVLDIPKAPFDPARPNRVTDADELLFGPARVVMSALLATIGFVAGSVLFGTGVAVLAPTGHLAPILAGLFLWLLGEAAKSRVLDAVMNLTIPRPLRKIYPESWLRSHLLNRAADTEHAIRTEIILSLLGGYPNDDPEKNTKEQQARQNQAEIVHKIAVGIDAALRQRAEEASILIT